MVLLIIPCKIVEAKDIKVIYKGVNIAKGSVKPYIDENNRTMVPLRSVSEGLGADVEYESGSVYIELDDTKINLTLGSKEIIVNGKKYTMDTVPVLKNNVTMVPIRFVAQFLGVEVKYEDDGNIYLYDKERKSSEDYIHIGRGNSDDDKEDKERNDREEDYVEMCTGDKTFGMASYRDMPEFGDGTDQWNKLLYYAGIKTGIDPVFLKTIMKKESGGNAYVEDNRNTNGTIDRGIMQINSDAARGVFDWEKLKEPTYNIWAATQIIKDKYNLVLRLAENGRDINAVEARPDSFTLFWTYNGFSPGGLLYAASIDYEPYVSYTRVPNNAEKRQVGTGTNVEYNLHAETYSPVELCFVVTNDEKITWEEFKEYIEEMLGKTVEEIDKLKDNSKNTGLFRFKTGIDNITEFKIYEKVKIVVLIIHKIAVVISFLNIILLVFLWVLWILFNLGIYYIADIVRFISGDRFNFEDDNTLHRLIIITIVSILLIVAVLSGFISQIIEVLITKLILLLT